MHTLLRPLRKAESNPVTTFIPPSSSLLSSSCEAFSSRLFFLELLVAFSLLISLVTRFSDLVRGRGNCDVTAAVSFYKMMIL